VVKIPHKTDNHFVETKKDWWKYLLKQQKTCENISWNSKRLVKVPLVRDNGLWKYLLKQQKTCENISWNSKRLVKVPLVRDDYLWKYLLKQKKTCESTSCKRWLLVKTPLDNMLTSYRLACNILGIHSMYVCVPLYIHTCWHACIYTCIDYLRTCMHT
jgi:hypothetical protein